METRKWYQSLKVNNTLTALKKNGFEASYVSTKEEAVLKILEIVPLDALVGLAGSITLREMGLPEALRTRGNKVIDHTEARQRNASTEEVLKIMRLHLNTDVFITSTTAITETGELVNICSSGQRVATMIFGPKKVIVIAGVNKMVSTLDEGVERAFNIAQPMHAKRRTSKNPCVVTGMCSDCDSQERICNVTTVIHRKLRHTPTIIILVGEELGY